MVEWFNFKNHPKWIYFIIAVVILGLAGILYLRYKFPIPDNMWWRFQK